MPHREREGAATTETLFTLWINKGGTQGLEKKVDWRNQEVARITEVTKEVRVTSVAEGLP